MTVKTATPLFDETALGKETELLARVNAKEKI